MDWIDAATPPPDSRPDCIVKMNDGSERFGNSCHDPRDGRFVGWMFDGGVEPDDLRLEVVGWRYPTEQ